MSCGDKTWLTKDGDEIVLHDLDDRHLLNAIKYCKRVLEPSYRKRFEQKLVDLEAERDRRGGQWKPEPEVKPTGGIPVRIGGLGGLGRLGPFEIEEIEDVERDRRRDYP